MRNGLARHNLRVVAGNKRGATPSRTRTAGKAAKPRKAHRREAIFRLATPNAQDRRPRTPPKTHTARAAVALHRKKAKGAPRKIAVKPDRIAANPDRITGITTLPRAESRAPSAQRAAMTALALENNVLRRQNRELKTMLQSLQRQLHRSDVNQSLAINRSLEAANRELREEIRALRARAAAVISLAPGAPPRREDPSFPFPPQPVPEPDRATELPAPPPVAVAPEDGGTADIYDSLFTGHVDTPDVIPDPAVWDIVQAGVPEDYVIPDPEFTEELARALAEEQLGRTTAS